MVGMEEPDDFSTVLLGDMTAAIRRLKDDHPRERRAFIRAAFAAVEGHLAGLCQDLLARATGGLTETERMALREESYRVSDSGRIETIPAHQPLKHRVKLVTGIVKRLHPEYAIDFGSAGWQALLTGLDVRHRITHPKTRQDMNVESAELEAALNGVFWFLATVISSGHEGIAAYVARHFTLADLDRLAEGIPLSQLLGLTPGNAQPYAPAGEKPIGDTD
jgi:hypothetical protein